MQLFTARTPSPIGALTLVWDDVALRALDFNGFEERFQRLLRTQYGECQLAEAQVPNQIGSALEAYFAGDIQAIDTLPVRTGGTAFQQRVWTALREILPGTTTSYGELAKRLGNAAATRAVGRANGANPIGVVVPCHRVIGADGSLTGYGGGMDRKRWLLDHERTHLFQLVG